MVLRRENRSTVGNAIITKKSLNMTGLCNIVSQTFRAWNPRQGWGVYLLKSAFENCKAPWRLRQLPKNLKNIRLEI